MKAFKKLPSDNLANAINMHAYEMSYILRITNTKKQCQREHKPSPTAISEKNKKSLSLDSHPEQPGLCENIILIQNIVFKLCMQYCQNFSK